MFSSVRIVDLKKLMYEDINQCIRLLSWYGK